MPCCNLIKSYFKLKFSLSHALLQQAVMNKIKGAGFWVSSGFSMYMNTIGTTMFMTHTVNELLWGFKDPLLSRLKTIRPEVDEHFGLLLNVRFISSHSRSPHTNTIQTQVHIYNFFIFLALVSILFLRFEAWMMNEFVSCVVRKTAVMMESLCITPESRTILTSAVFTPGRDKSKTSSRHSNTVKRTPSHRM